MLYSNADFCSHRLMYWSEKIGGESRIEQAGMDGSNRKVLINQGLGWPTSLVLDQLSWKIFWSDDKFHCIGSANLDGTGISVSAFLILDSSEMVWALHNVHPRKLTFTILFYFIFKYFVVYAMTVVLMSPSPF